MYVFSWEFERAKITLSVPFNNTNIRYTAEDNDTTEISQNKYNIDSLIHGSSKNLNKLLLRSKLREMNKKGCKLSPKHKISN